MNMRANASSVSEVNQGFVAVEKFVEVSERDGKISHDLAAAFKKTLSHISGRGSMLLPGLSKGKSSMNLHHALCMRALR